MGGWHFKNKENFEKKILNLLLRQKVKFVWKKKQKSGKSKSAKKKTYIENIYKKLYIER